MENFKWVNRSKMGSFIIRKWQWSFWCINNFEDKIPNYYLERKSYLDIVEYSIIRVKNQNLANELFLRIKEKEEKNYSNT